ncbi:MAG: NAD(P)/FAD-dependent oxidoreductase [Acidobacteriia bacterium]|nr:NAD(P)/FAD-dependent oxidoreductase [Terriglobia bacterium]
MDRRIPRRDFLNGVALSVAALGLRGAPIDLFAQGAAEYPPSLTGLRGNYPDAVGAFGPMGQGAYRQFPALDADTNETHDLVIVGAGISGLAAAHFWRRALGASQKILILDNHDDFGGHAKRNEFTYRGRTFIGYGGTQSIATPFPYSYTAKRLIEELTIQVERNGEFQNRGPLGNLGPAMFFDKEHFGEDRLVAGNGRLPWPEFFAKAPLSDAARKDLIRIYGTNPDYMAGMTAEQKIAKLASISWQDFLLRYAKMTPEALPFFLGQGGRNNKRVDTTPALEAAKRGSAGFNGLGLTFEEEFRESSYTFHFPDGNASIARLLVSRLIPAALPPGKTLQTMETIVQAPMMYERLDEATSDVRIRLKSTVVRVEHSGSPARADVVRVAYRRDGKIHGVRGRHVILACYNSLIPSLVPELSAKQKDALAYSIKVPMMYNNVLIRRWTAFQKLGVSNISAPGMYHTSCGLDPGTSIGGYRGVTTADEPIVVRLVRNPNTPGLPRREQHRAGQQELLSMSFEQFELEIRRQLARMLAGGGFDPAADIVGITVNRWPHGYSYTYDTLADPEVAPEERPHVIGRRRFGRIAIANSDAGAAAFTNQAIDEANRAVEELFVAEGLA